MKADCRVHCLLAWQDIPEKISLVLRFNIASEGSMLYPEYWIGPPEYLEISVRMKMEKQNITKQKTNTKNVTQRIKEQEIYFNVFKYLKVSLYRGLALISVNSREWERQSHLDLGSTRKYNRKNTTHDKFSNIELTTLVSSTDRLWRETIRCEDRSFNIRKEQGKYY